MAPEDDDDPAIVDWGEAADTKHDAVPLEAPTETPTAPHRTLGPEVDRAFESGRDAGCRACYTDGQTNATAAFRRVLAEHAGLTPPEIDRVVEWAARYMDAL